MEDKEMIGLLIDRAKRIVNHAVVNEDPNARIIRFSSSVPSFPETI
jgi:hypothetical protein